MRIRYDADVPTVTMKSETNNADYGPGVNQPLVPNGEVVTPKSFVSIKRFS